MNLNVLQFFIGQQLALNQGVSRSQATSDALASALVKSPLGMLLALFLARGQASRAKAQVPTITTQPQDQTVDLGDPATFTVVASGTMPLSYQWLDHTNTAIAGATSASYTTPLTGNTDDGSVFSVVVTSAAGGSVTSTPATLHVDDDT